MDDQVLDARGLICPMPVLKMQKALRTLPVGAVLQIRSTDPAAVIDFRAFCATTGNRLLSIERSLEPSAEGEVEVTVFRIEKTVGGTGPAPAAP